MVLEFSLPKCNRTFCVTEVVGAVQHRAGESPSIRAFSFGFVVDIRPRGWLSSCCKWRIMLLATINKSKQLLHLSYIGEVRAEEVAQSRAELVTLMGDLSPGFRLLTDLGRLESISPDCVHEIGKVMELCDQKGVELIVRVIPDPAKDVGLSILSLFHYHGHPPTVTCQSMVEAVKALAL